MAEKEILESLDGEYKYGFTTDIETDTIARGLNEAIEWYKNNL